VAAGLATAAALICCLGGVFGIGSLVVLGNRVVHEQAQQAVQDYLTAIQKNQVSRAYDLVCGQTRDSVSLDAFRGQVGNGASLSSFNVEKAVDVDGQSFLVVALQTYADGHVEVHHYRVVPEGTELHICNITG
jgi:hypothetical protein